MKASNILATLVDFRNASYDTGYYAGKAEAGGQINIDLQRQRIADRSLLEKQLIADIEELVHATQSDRTE